MANPLFPAMSSGQTNESMGGPSWLSQHFNTIMGLGSSITPFPMSLGFDMASAANQGSFNPWFGGQQGKIDPGFMSTLDYWTNPGNLIGQFGDLFGSHNRPNVPPLMSSMDQPNTDVGQHGGAQQLMGNGVGYSQLPSLNYTYGGQGQTSTMDPGSMVQYGQMRAQMFGGGSPGSFSDPRRL